MTFSVPLNMYIPCFHSCVKIYNYFFLLNGQRKYYGYLSKVSINKIFRNSRGKEEIINKDI